MNKFVKLLIILVILYLGASSYKLIDGTQITNTDETMIASDTSRFVRAYFYNNPFQDNYVVIIVTENGRHLVYRTNEQIALIRIAGHLTLGLTDLVIREHHPIPWWVFLILIFIVMKLPNRNRIAVSGLGEVANNENTYQNHVADMLCSHCGVLIQSEARFCAGCGNTVV